MSSVRATEKTGSGCESFRPFAYTSVLLYTHIRKFWGQICMHKSIVGITAFVAAILFSSGAFAAASWEGYGHKLRIKLDGSATKSIWVVGTAAPGWENDKLNGCVRLTNPPRGWMETAFVLKNGSSLKVLAFSSTDCTNGLRRERRMTVPGADGLAFVYMPMF